MHYTKTPWPDTWPNFRPREFACRCCGEIWEGDGPMPEAFAEALDALQSMRNEWGKPMVINSGHRCKGHNAEVGGTEGSQHLAIAFDIAVPADQQAEFASLAERHGFTGIGRYPKRGFVHLDMGTTFPRRWRG